MANRLIISLVLLSSTSTLAAELKPSLCSSSEKIVFSCSIKKKIVSLCATPDITAKTGRLTYRFGTSNSASELEFSSDELGPASSFTSYFENWAKGSYSAISFKRGEYSYTVYNRMAAFEENDRSNGGGVQIYQNHKQIADLWCIDASIRDNIWKTLHSLELPSTPAP